MAALKVLVPIAEDSEEIETACITDTLVRAGAAVTVASVSGDLQVKMSRGLKIVADCKIEDCADKEWDAIACPGGMPGAERLRDSKALEELLRNRWGGARARGETLVRWGSPSCFPHETVASGPTRDGCIWLGVSYRLHSTLFVYTVLVALQPRCRLILLPASFAQLRLHFACCRWLVP